MGCREQQEYVKLEGEIEALSERQSELDRHLSSISSIDHTDLAEASQQLAQVRDWTELIPSICISGLVTVYWSSSGTSCKQTMLPGSHSIGAEQLIREPFACLLVCTHAANGAYQGE